MVKASPPNARTICRAERTAAASPSIAKGTPMRDGIDPVTNVISGWTEATTAPPWRKDFSSSLASAPLEWKAIFFLQSTTDASWRDDDAISRSGTQNQTRSASRRARSLVEAWALTFLARSPAFRFDAALLPETISEIVYSARFSSCANALPSLPGPTIAIRDFAAIAGSISGQLLS